MIRINVIKAYILGIYNYSALLLLGTSLKNLKMLNRSLNWALRSIVHTKQYQDVTEIKERFNILKPSEFVKLQSLTRFYTIIYSSNGNKLKTMYGVEIHNRTQKILTSPIIKSNYMQHSFIKESTKLWNSLDRDLTSRTPLKNFKKRLKLILLNKGNE